MNHYCLNFENPIGDAISRIRFASQSNNLLISSWDSSLRLYDVDNSVVRLEISSEAALLDCCFRDESAAFSAGSDGLIRRYDLHTGTLEMIGNHEDIATCVQYSDETCQVVTAGLDRRIVSWDMRMAKTLDCLRKLDADVESMSLSGFCLMAAVGASLRIYDLRNLDRPVRTKESHMDTQIKCVTLVHSKGFATGSVDGRVALEIASLSDSNSNEYIFRCDPKKRKGHLVSVNEIVFNPVVDHAFVTGDNDGFVVAWDARNRRRLSELPRHPNSVASLSYNHDGQVLAVASSYTYQEGYEREEPPQIFIHEVDESFTGSSMAGSSNKK